MVVERRDELGHKLYYLVTLAHLFKKASKVYLLSGTMYHAVKYLCDLYTGSDNSCFIDVPSILTFM